MCLYVQEQHRAFQLQHLYVNVCVHRCAGMCVCVCVCVRVMCVCV